MSLESYEVQGGEASPAGLRVWFEHVGKEDRAYAVVLAVSGVRERKGVSAVRAGSEGERSIGSTRIG